MISRRQLLSAGVTFSALTYGGLNLHAQAMTAPKTGNKLMVIFLRGAYDALSVVVPTGSDFYFEARPNISIMRPDPANLLASLRLDRDWSLHPALAESIYPLWQAGQVAFVPFAGTDDVSRSHFETQDTIELGQPIENSRDYNSGFLGRIARELGASANPVSFTQDVPLVYRGAVNPIPNLAVNLLSKPNIDAHTQSLIESMYKTPAAEALVPLIGVQTGFSSINQAFDIFADEMDAASKGAPEVKGFPLYARRMAELMGQGYDLAFFDIGGWDTHVSQGNAEGDLAKKVGELGRGLAEFARASGPDWNKTTVVVISEFGRTFHENGDKGTDHGHGSVYWVLGGTVKGGRIAGPQQKLVAETLFENRDLPVLTDYRGLIGGVVSRLYGFNADAMARIFPGTPKVDLGLV